MYLHLNINNSLKEINSDTTGILLSQSQFDSIMLFVHNNAEALKYGCIIIDPLALTCSIDTAALNNKILSEAQKAKEAEIRQACAKALDAIVTPYLEQERETWETELSEAIAWQANNANPTPFLDAAITASTALYPTDTKAAYINEIITKAATYKTATGAIIGRRRGLLKQVYDPTTTIVGVQAIKW